MTNPYRRSGQAPEGEEDDAPPSPRVLGRRVSSHPRVDLAARASAAVGEAPAIELHANGLVVQGVLGRPREVFFADVDSIFHQFEGDGDLPRVSLRTFEGERLDLPPVVHVERIVEALDREVGLPLVVPAKERLVRGEPLYFGPLLLELTGIVVSDGEPRALPWSRLPRVIVSREGFAFHMPDTHGRFAFVALAEVPHPRVLVEVLRLRSKVVLHDLEALGTIGIGTLEA